MTGLAGFLDLLEQVFFFLARRRRLKILTLNLHCYQEENQDAKFSQIAKAIDDLDIDVVCLLVREGLETVRCRPSEDPKS